MKHQVAPFDHRAAGTRFFQPRFNAFNAHSERMTGQAFFGIFLQASRREARGEARGAARGEACAAAHGVARWPRGLGGWAGLGSPEVVSLAISKGLPPSFYENIKNASGS